MARKTSPRSPRPVTIAVIAKLQRDVHNCSEEIERLKVEIEINVRRMGAMQAELDHLRSKF
jgi:hypothetical protein